MNIGYVRIKEAFICADCSTIYHQSQDYCPCCTSYQYIKLDKIFTPIENPTEETKLKEN